VKINAGSQKNSHFPAVILPTSLQLFFAKNYFIKMIEIYTKKI